MDKMENKSGAQTNTASTLCMKAVRFNRGRGREEESAARLKCVSAISCRCNPNSHQLLMLQLRKDSAELHILQLGRMS